MDYGRKIRELRRNAGLTQAELGKELSVTSQAVSKWENGQSEPDLSSIDRMCGIFGVSPNVFFETKLGDDGNVDTFEIKMR